MSNGEQPIEKKEIIARAPRPLVKAGFTFLPDTWESLYAYAKEISQTDFVPKSMIGKPGAVLACWQKGQEVGLPPMAALESIAIINGRPSIHSYGYWSLIISHPLCEWFRETAPDEALKQGYGECTIKRRGNLHEVTRRFSMEEAKAAGLLTKDNWKNYPGDMLQNRARHRAGDDAIPEAAQGLLPADVARDIPEEPRDVTPEPLKIPRPIKEPSNGQPAVASSSKPTDSENEAPGEAHQEEAEPGQATEAAANGESKPEKEPEKSVEEVALEEIAGYTAATFPNPKDINHFLKGQPGKVQARICAEYNRKKRELGL